MDQRTQFIADYLREVLTVTELCDLYGISRKTGYKWIERYLRCGPAGLEERSRKPRVSLNATDEEIVSALLEVRRRHPSWSADVKGQFKTGDGITCYPLTVTDGYSRYLLGCQALHSTAVREAKPVFTRLFKEYGLPTRIRTDNGVPFATHTLARLSSLSAWWVRLGAMPELIEPGKPQQNGRHERPHEALDQQTPASLYQSSPREMPHKLPALDYPDRFEGRYVSANGGIRWNSDWVNVSIVCAGEYVGLEEIDDGIWNVYFGPLKLGRLLERHRRIEDAYGRLKRHQV